jgi:hypothetical protein
MLPMLRFRPDKLVEQPTRALQHTRRYLNVTDEQLRKRLEKFGSGGRRR